MPGPNESGATSVAFGRRVRALRKRKGRTLRFFAVKANVHFTYLGQIERGEHNLSLLNIIRLAHVLGVDPGELVRGLKLPAEPGG